MEELPQDRARALLRLGSVEEASRIAEGEIRRAGDVGNTSDLWALRFVRLEIWALRGHVEDALRYLEALPAPNPTDVKSCASVKMYQGGYCGSLGRFRQAHQLLSEAEALARYANSVDLLGEVHLSHAFIFFLHEDYNASDRLYHEILGLAEQIGGWYFRGHGLWGVGKIMMIQRRYQEAMAWLAESLRIFEEAGARLALATVWGELAVCHLGLGDDEAALELNLRAAQLEFEAGFVHNYQVSLANIGNVYLHRRDYFTALSYYQRALSLAREIKDPVSVRKWTYNINLAYARIRVQVDQEFSCPVP